MPHDVKAVLSVIALIVAAVLAYWSKSPVHHDLSTIVMITAEKRNSHFARHTLGLW